ncbi:hypothetical protein ACFFSY_00915 [Paenibacillus aurantiacus]|uniref:Uncharacterized protein n=1 Tax=Paenibacillus aurantiacus TaxID=1936118 RepID=A0ABV5KH58_9BACL
MKKILALLIFVLILSNITTFYLYQRSENTIATLQQQLTATNEVKGVSGIDIIDLLKLLAIDNDGGNITTLNDWKVLSDNENIEWETEGIGNGERRGKLLVLINGNWIPRLEKTVEPTYWDLHLYGPRAGVNEFNLSIPINSQELGFDLASELEKKGIQFEQIKGFNEAASFGNMGYVINFPNKRSIWVNYSWSAGTAGLSVDLQGYYAVEGLDEIEYNS